MSIILKSSLIILTIFVIGSCNPINYQQGKRSYDRHCASCHMEDGTGLVKLVPDVMFSKDELLNMESLPCMIRHGINSPDSIFQMLPNKEISEIEITNVINYILHDLNSIDSSYTLERTKSELKACHNTRE